MCNASKLLNPASMLPGGDNKFVNPASMITSSSNRLVNPAGSLMGDPKAPAQSSGGTLLTGVQQARQKSTSLLGS